MPCCDICECCTDVCCEQPPVSASGPAICTAVDTATGTQDTANAVITSASSFLAGFFGAKQKQQATAVKAQVRLAQTKQWTTALMVIAVLVAIVFVFGTMPTRK